MKKLLTILSFLTIALITFAQINVVGAAPKGNQNHVPSLPISAPPGHAHSNHNPQAGQNGIYRLVNLGSN